MLRQVGGRETWKAAGAGLSHSTPASLAAGWTLRRTSPPPGDTSPALQVSSPPPQFGQGRQKNLAEIVNRGAPGDVGAPLEENGGGRLGLRERQHRLGNEADGPGAAVVAPRRKETGPPGGGGPEGEF